MRDQNFGAELCRWISCRINENRDTNKTQKSGKCDDEIFISPPRLAVYFGASENMENEKNAVNAFQVSCNNRTRGIWEISIFITMLKGLFDWAELDWNWIGKRYLLSKFYLEFLIFKVDSQKQINYVVICYLQKIFKTNFFLCNIRSKWNFYLLIWLIERRLNWNIEKHSLNLSLRQGKAF